MAEHCDVLIIGAGAAGIGAARQLLGDGGATASPRVVVLEARHRAGGRAWSSDELRCRLELDHLCGEWIHRSSSVRGYSVRGSTVRGSTIRGSNTCRSSHNGYIL